MFYLILLPFFTACKQEKDPLVFAYQIESLDQIIGGPASLAQPGDYIIENENLRFAILGKRPSMGPHTAGGSLIDADIRRSSAAFANGFGNDQLAEVFGTINMNIPLIDQENGELVILSDGSNGTDAIICASGIGYPFITLLQAMWGFLGWLDEDSYLQYTIRNDYILSSEDTVLTMKTTLMVGDNDGCSDDLADVQPFPSMSNYVGIESLIDIALDKGFLVGDFYLQGGDLNVFTPNVGFDERGKLFELELEEFNTFTNPIEADFLAGVGNNVSYGIIAPNSPLYIPLFTSSQTAGIGGAIIPEIETTGTRLPDGTKYQYERWFTVGQGDVGSVLDAFFAHQQKVDPDGIEIGNISGNVVEAGTGVTLSDVSVFAYKVNDDGTTADGPWSQWQTDVGIEIHPTGVFGGNLPTGTWDLQAYKTGRPIGEKIRVNLTSNGIRNLTLELDRPGSVHYTVTDEVNQPLPAKISFFSVDGQNTLNAKLGDTFIPNNPAAVIYAPTGTGTTSLPEGKYYALASRGIEYEIDISEPFTVRSDSRTELDLQILKSVDTSGWLSTDLHVHSFPSHDVGVSAHMRVATMACEGVEYFATTDHDYIIDFAPAIQDLGLEEWVTTTPGVEVTTVEIGHYIGFPLQVNRLDDAGGTVDWTGLEPQEILDSLTELKPPNNTEPPLLYVAHPRAGIQGYFDQYGYNPYQSTPEQMVFDENILAADFLESMTQSTPIAGLLKPSLFSTQFHAIEILNGLDFETIRTPLQPELDQYATEYEELETPMTGEQLFEFNREHNYQILTRTMEEQQSLIDGAADPESSYRLGQVHHGAIDDWFSLLNLGYTFTGLGNSDTHSVYTKQSGYPRNYVFVGGDEPLTADDEEIAAAIKAGKVISTFGPFVEFFANNDPNTTVGSTVSTSADGTVDFTIRVQSPTWFDIGHVELYENGTLIKRFEVQTPNTSTMNFSTTETVVPQKDSWYAVIVTGAPDADISPIASEVFRPVIDLQDIVIEALSQSESASILVNFLDIMPPIPRTFPILPYAFTNPIYVDTDGDNEITPPGLPEWMIDPSAE